MVQAKPARQLVATNPSTARRDLEPSAMNPNPEGPSDAGGPPTMFVMVGLPASGKTSRALELAAAWSALLLTPRRVIDPPLRTGAARGQAQHPGGSVDLANSVRAARWGSTSWSTSVCRARTSGRRCERWRPRSEQSARWFYLKVDEEEQRRRVQARSETDAATTFKMTRADLERWRQTFQLPDATELATAEIESPPAGFDSWEASVAQW